MSYPARSADNEASVECFIQQNFIQRLNQGYSEAGLVSHGEKEPAQLERDANGLPQINW